MGKLTGSHDGSRTKTVQTCITSLHEKLPHVEPHLRSCLEAALWLWADDLETAHRLCQDVPTLYGAAWHAVMHRREPDFFNSKYWWRRAGGVKWTTLQYSLRDLVNKRLASKKHPLLQSFRAACTQNDDPCKFVDLVERSQQSDDTDLLSALLDIQRLEWGVLFLETWERATASPAPH